eukprot:COSAG05_NODE_256_length_12752_cov_5.614795_1_plen_385_part_00
MHCSAMSAPPSGGRTGVATGKTRMSNLREAEIQHLAADHVAALHVAAALDDAEEVDRIVAGEATAGGLVPRNSTINAMDADGETMLHAAARTGAATTVRRLLRVPGVDVNACGKLLRTPLMVCALNGHVEVLELLLVGGARPAMLDVKWKTARDLATLHGHDAAAETLSEEGLKRILQSSDRVLARQTSALIKETAPYMELAGERAPAKTLPESEQSRAMKTVLVADRTITQRELRNQLDAADLRCDSAFVDALVMHVGQGKGVSPKEFGRLLPILKRHSAQDPGKRGSLYRGGAEARLAWKQSGAVSALQYNVTGKNQADAARTEAERVAASELREYQQLKITAAELEHANRVGGAAAIGVVTLQEGTDFASSNTKTPARAHR